MTRAITVAAEPTMTADEEARWVAEHGPAAEEEPRFTWSTDGNARYFHQVHHGQKTTIWNGTTFKSYRLWCGNYFNPRHRMARSAQVREEVPSHLQACPRCFKPGELA